MNRTKVSMQEIIEASQKVIASYDIKLTVRQIYYQLVTRQVIMNSQSAYKSVVRALTAARRSGEVDFGAIEDRGRSVHTGDGAEDETPEEYLEDYIDTIKSLDQYYDIPKWWGQPVKVQVWVEKEALSSLFKQVTDDLGVDLVVCKGYPSLSLLYEAAGTLDDMPEYVERFQIVYFGDFDPSGTDIERFVGESLADDFDVEIDVERVAITVEQIEEFNIPPDPAKTTDSRYERFVAETGTSWQVELDAIEPRTLQKIIREAIERYFDNDLGDDRDSELEERREKMRGLLATTLKEFLED